MSQPVAESSSSTADPFALRPIGPSPEGALQLTVDCRTVRTGGPGNRHRVRIETDWSVRTPHDLGLERIASAMGGYLSCVELVDREAPALRDLVQLRARRVLPGFARNVAGRWSLRNLAPGCRCRAEGFASAAEAAGHARDLDHLARLHGAVPQRLERLLHLVEQAHGTRFQLPPPDAWDTAGAVRERDGLASLWAAGVHPLVVSQLHEALWPGGPPMPVWFYLGAVSRRPDLAWLAETLAAVPDEDVAVWLCWTDTELDRTHPEARIAWLRAGVSRNSIAALADGAYSPVDVARLVARTRRSVCSAAATLAAWHRAGCHPSPEDIALIDMFDADPWFEPSIGAINWLAERVGGLPTGPTRTEIGLLLAVCGTRSGVLSVLERGIRDPREAARLMNGDDSPVTDPTVLASSPVAAR